MGLVFHIILFYLMMFPLLIIHEFGHAVTARLLGFKIFSITIGYGEQLFQASVFGIKIKCNLYPFYGLTFAIPQDSKRSKLKMWLFVLGGPITHIIFILACLFIYQNDINSLIFARGIASGFEPVKVLFYANVVLLLVNIIPRKVNSIGTGIYTDGFYLLKIPFAKKEKYAELVNYIPHMEAAELLHDGFFDRAIVKYEQLTADEPDDVLIKHNLAIARLGHGKYQEALDTLIEILEAPEPENEQFKRILKNNVAFVICVLNQADKFIEAESFSREAYEAFPKFPPFIGTRGAVLIRTGRLKEGIELSEKAYKFNTIRHARASNACMIALGEAKMGNFKNAHKWMSTARREYLDEPLIPIIAKEVEELNTLISEEI